VNLVDAGCKEQNPENPKDFFGPVLPRQNGVKQDFTV
jgi:hypothetical protein